MDFNSKGDCINKETTVLVEAECCNELKACRDDVITLLQATVAHGQHYMEVCGMVPNEIEDKYGKPTVKEGSMEKLCDKSCPGPSQMVPQYDLNRLSDTCGDMSELRQLKRIAAFVDALDTPKMGTRQHWISIHRLLYERDEDHRLLQPHGPRNSRTRICGFPKTGAIRTRFQIEAIADLGQRLVKKGHTLSVRTGISTAACFEQLCEDFDVKEKR